MAIETQTYLEKRKKYIKIFVVGSIVIGIIFAILIPVLYADQIVVKDGVKYIALNEGSSQLTNLLAFQIACVIFGGFALIFSFACSFGLIAIVPMIIYAIAKSKWNRGKELENKGKELDNESESIKMKKRETMKVQCPYCESLVSIQEDNCPNCGGALNIKDLFDNK